MEQQHCGDFGKKWGVQLQPNSSSLGSASCILSTKGMFVLFCGLRKWENTVKRAHSSNTPPASEGGLSVVTSSSTWRQLFVSKRTNWQLGHLPKPTDLANPGGKETLYLEAEKLSAAAPKAPSRPTISGTTAATRGAPRCPPRCGGTEVGHWVFTTEQFPLGSAAAEEDGAVVWQMASLLPHLPCSKCPKSLGRASRAGDPAKREAHGRQQPLCPRESFQKSARDQLLNTSANKAGDWKCHFAASWQ